MNMETLTSEGRLRDFSGSGNDGIISGTTVIEGIFGKARRFSYVKDRIALPTNPSLDIKGPLSIAIWVRVHRLGLHQHMLACDNRFAFWFTEENRLRFVDSMSHGLMTNWKVDKDVWYSIVGVFGGTEGDALTQQNIGVWVNGEPVDTDQLGTAWGHGKLFSKDACYVGFESHQGDAQHQTLWFDGDIDELLIFSRTLTEPEIRAHAIRGPSTHD